MIAIAPVVNILEKLIAFDTTSSNSNLDLMAYVQDYLHQHGVVSELIRDPQQPKANLFATIGPIIKSPISKSPSHSGIMLSGHTDTVPVTGQQWHYDPYQLSHDDDRNNDRYYGRGTADMKGFIACVLAAVPTMAAANLRHPIHLAFSYDEEIGCLGVRHLIERLQNYPCRPVACIIGEPTSMEVATAHKGKLGIEVQVQGKECHSGMAPEGVNAINYAARMIQWLEALALEKQQQGPFQDIFSPPFTTVHTGVINGGVALNIVPNECRFRFEIRNIAIEDPQELLIRFGHYVADLRQEMQQKSPQCDIVVTELTSYPRLQTPEHTEIVKLIRQLAGNTKSIKTINFGTEGGLFNDLLQVTTVVCGPGSMQQGHKPNEYVTGEQLRQCWQFLHRLVDHLAD